MSRKDIPNIISVLRMVLVAPIVYLLLSERYQLALLLIVVASVSDALDGFLAKRYGWSTRLGAFLDPAGDKLLIAWSYGTLAYLGNIPVWLAFIVIFRDVVIVAGSFMYHYLVRRLEGQPTWISKLNTVLEFVFLVLVIWKAGYDWPDDVTITIFGAAVLVTVVLSGYDYVSNWIRSAQSVT